MPGQILRLGDEQVDEMPWGRLMWMVGGRLDNSTTLTVGQCHINVGSENPRHYHPNCDEVLHVLGGRIEHSLGDELFTMSVGDTVSIPTGTIHNARNVGDEMAVLMICFSTADRQVIQV